jgi:hypothetical protein
LAIILNLSSNVHFSQAILMAPRTGIEIIKSRIAIIINILATHITMAVITTDQTHFADAIGITDLLSLTTRPDWLGGTRISRNKTRDSYESH